MLATSLLVFVFSAALAVTLASVALAYWRLSRKPAGPGIAPLPVSIVRPVSGPEPYSRSTLESGFRLDHPDYELIFCAHNAKDPIVPLVRGLIEAHPNVPARLLIGDEGRSANPKLDNCLKGWAAAKHDWIVLADSNVEMPPDYLSRLFAAWRPNSGLVCSMPLGTKPDGFWAEVECAFLNGFQARWQYAAEAAGSGYAQGKSMLWNRRFLDDRGGLIALGVEAAEDAAATKLVRRAGARVHLVDRPFPQPIGPRRSADVWRRQLRWARLRRVTFPPLYLLECFTSPLVAAGGLALVGPTPYLGLAGLALCYGAEIGLVRRLGWQAAPRVLPAMLMRDIVLPAIWLAGFVGREVSWHGRTVPVARAAKQGAPAGAFP